MLMLVQRHFIINKITWILIVQVIFSIATYKLDNTALKLKDKQITINTAFLMYRNENLICSMLSFNS
jgi:hypothetical protein